MFAVRLRSLWLLHRGGGSDGGGSCGGCCGGCGGERMVLVAVLSEPIRVGLLACRTGAARLSYVVFEYAWAVPRVLRALR